MTGRILYSSLRARPELLQPARPGDHVWTVMTMHVVPAAALLEGEPVYLDAESIAQTMTGCYVCEQPYSERLAHRKCPGDPSD